MLSMTKYSTVFVRCYCLKCKNIKQQLNESQDMASSHSSTLVIITINNFPSDLTNSDPTKKNHQKIFFKALRRTKFLKGEYNGHISKCVLDYCN